MSAPAANDLLDWVTQHRLNEYSDVLGLLITVAGFSFTLYNLWRARQASAKAVAIAEDVRKEIYKIDTIAELSAAVMAMESVKNHARLQAFAHIPNQLAELKHRLARIRSASALSQDDQVVLQGAIAQFSTLEAKIDKAIEANTAPAGWARDNSVLSTHIDRVHAVLNGLKNGHGSNQ